MMAVSNGHEDVVELLLATSDVNINHVDKEGETAWDLAREHKNIVEMLQSYSLRVAMDRLGEMIEKIN
jgi:ankyrin repeat protein